MTSLAENNRVGAVLAVASAVDRDRGLNGRLTYSLQPGATASHWVAVDRVRGEFVVCGRGSSLVFSWVAVDP